MAQWDDDHEALDEDGELSVEFVDRMRAALVSRRAELEQRSKRALDEIMEHERVEGDSLDESSAERDTSTMLVLKDMDMRELHRIDAALRRIEEGTYGLCEVTGEVINPRRLEINPMATLSLEAQEELEAEQRRNKIRPGFFDT